MEWLKDVRLLLKTMIILKEVYLCGTNKGRKKLISIC